MNQFENFDLDELEEEEDKEKLAIATRFKKTEQSIAKRFRSIFRKNLEQLTLEDKKYLKARSFYMTKGQREEYTDVLAADYSSGKEVQAAPAAPKLETLKREVLEAMASDLGIENPQDLPNRDAIIEAIKKAQ